MLRSPHCKGGAQPSTRWKSVTDSKSGILDQKLSSADAVGSVRFEALLHLASRLAGIGERLRGTPIAKDIEDIVQGIRDEADTFTVATVTDLANTISRIAEEREEIRTTLAKRLTVEVERGDKLQEECTRLSEEEAAAAHAFPVTLRSELAAALQEEADASRAARSNLLAENANLRNELTQERVERKTLKAECDAMLVLQNARRHTQELRSAKSSSLLEARSLPTTSSTLQAPVEKIDADPVSNLQVLVSSPVGFCRDGNERTCGTSVDRSMASRKLKFACRDFQSKAGD